MSESNGQAVTSQSDLFENFLNRLRESKSRVQVHAPNPLGDDTSGHDPRIILDHIANLRANNKRLRALLDEAVEILNNSTVICYVPSAIGGRARVNRITDAAHR